MNKNSFDGPGSSKIIENWEELFDAIPHSTVILDKDHRILAANKKLMDLLKKPFAEIVEAKCWEIFHDSRNTGPSKGCPFEKMLSSGIIEFTEMEVEAFEGTYIVSCTPLFDKSGALSNVIHIAIDITERKRLEQQLESSTKEFRDISIMLETIFNSIPDIIGIQDQDHRIIRYNKAGYDYLKQSPQSIKGKRCFQLIGKDKPCTICATSEVYKTKKPSRIESFFPEISRWLEIRSYPVLDGKGKLEKVIEHLRDITDIKKAEEEKLFVERQLQHTAKMESLGVLAGGIAHDFNNLLGGIYGFIDMARLENTNPKVQEYLETILKTMNRARNLTQQLLTFSKGGSPLKKVGSLDEFLNETARFALSGSMVSLTLSIEPDLWPCAFDSDQMAQVIDNILINAQQAMPNGGSITLRAVNNLISDETSTKLQLGRYIKIQITDTGIGIPESIKGKIFDPFFTTKQKGSGLGLATSYSIVEKHGGTIEVESEVDRGSTFSIFLPASDNAEIQKPVKKKVLRIGTGRILVMDDEEIIRDLLSDILRKNGYEPVLCKDGKTTLDVFENSMTNREPFTAVILDLTVPGGLGGKETLAGIRNKNKTIPIFVTSGYSDDPIMQAPTEFGFTASIRKPFNIKELLNLLCEHL